MELRYAAHPEDAKSYTTERLRKDFLIENVLTEGEVTGVYSLYDRMMTIGAKPTDTPLEMPACEEFTKAEYFLERREMGILNVGESGTVTVDGEVFTLANKDCLYIGKGKKSVVFASDDAVAPAEFFICSTPAHKEYPTAKASQAEANPVELGAPATSNERTIFQYIHENGIKSCQLVMGFTALKPGSIWNTFPPHTHNRRMEIYFYFDLAENQAVMHFMGEPTETRHLVMKNKQAVISPEWSIHSGAGTAAYSFIWAMGGENQTFTDMDPAGTDVLK
ncbi:5-dehydro-4-deoxy-D-glucuronate isomerase [Flammeovirgaceae bacterium SG7u.111]|nr:5-dehydro-4-deoxy-D-glucuronate isomerase [Flammeovirgaceae bacterium SG7u.132]WPO35175.1 5-dehydro-4-deoxy-D-glucuronate isomerase [Flammeovirgaceae bacterium SG7u.111]